MSHVGIIHQHIQRLLPVTGPEPVDAHRNLREWLFIHARIPHIFLKLAQTAVQHLCILTPCYAGKIVGRYAAADTVRSFHCP